MADVLTLAALRETRGLTQTAVAQALEVSQPNVARIEAREDHYLSTLSEYIAALGGHLEITAVFPDQRISLVVPVIEHAGEPAPAVVADD
jgi:transcriptional regulator with XRE-family HTH domain